MSPEDYTQADVHFAMGSGLLDKAITALDALENICSSLSDDLDGGEIDNVRRLIGVILNQFSLAQDHFQKSEQYRQSSDER